MLDRMNSVFIVGIKGAAMANIARIVKQMGKTVSGSDTAEEYITDGALLSIGIKVITSFSATELPSNTELVIYSAAHGGKENPQVQEAISRGIQVMHQAEFIGELLKEFKHSVAVCGCHGKTTTSGLLAYALKNLQAHPSYLVGTSQFNDMYGGEYAGKDFFVLEADEYGVNPPADKTPKLNFINPTHIICTNIDFDHPDVYRDLDHTKEVFLQFFKKVQSNKPQLFFCADDINLMQVSQQLPKESYFTFGFSNQADLQIKDMSTNGDETTFGLKDTTFTISLFGEKNISNAAGVILFLMNQGFELPAIAQAVKGFSGAKRRFELVAKVNDAYLFDDYAHHPQEIETTIAAARSRFPDKRIVVIFQPHTFSRTQSLQAEFVDALSHADYVYILPIFPSARENKEKFSITSQELENIALRKDLKHIKGFSSKEELLLPLETELRKGDVVFTMGAGDVYKLKGKIISELEGLYT